MERIKTGQPTRQRVRFMLLHSRILFRESLARVLASQPGFKLEAICADPAEALESLAHKHPDVVIFDIGAGLGFVSNAREAGYTGRFLALAEEVNVSRFARALSNGVSGVFVGSDSTGRLIRAIRLVLNGEVWLDASVIQLLADRYPHHEDSYLNGLTDREQAVVKGLLGGFSNRKIGDQIGASEGTVKATLQQLFNKTGVRTRSQLVRMMLAAPQASGQIAREHGVLANQ